MKTESDELEAAKKQNEFIEKKFNEFMASKNGINFVKFMYPNVFVAGWEAKEEFIRIESEKICKWTFGSDVYMDWWFPSCVSHKFSLKYDTTPSQGGFLYCPFCGKLLIESEEKSDN